jgi:hypothetical protein
VEQVRSAPRELPQSMPKEQAPWHPRSRVDQLSAAGDELSPAHSKILREQVVAVLKESAPARDHHSQDSPYRILAADLDAGRI